MINNLHNIWSTCLQSTTQIMAKSTIYKKVCTPPLLNKNFGFDKTDISDMQHHCLYLHGIIKDVKLKKNTAFILVNNILYKEQNGNLLLAIPNFLARGFIFKLHSIQGFHFNSMHLQSQLKNLIYTKNLKDL